MACRSAANSTISMKARCRLRCDSARCFENGIRGHMTRSDFRKSSMLVVAVVSAALTCAVEAQAQRAFKSGDVLTGQLNAMRSRAKGKRVNSYQLVSEPQRLPPPAGL